VTLQLPSPANLDTALDVLTDASLTIEDRAAAYGVIHQVQLRLNRSLKKVRDELVTYLIQNKLKALGPLSLKSTAFDVEASSSGWCQSTTRFARPNSEPPWRWATRWQSNSTAS